MSGWNYRIVHRRQWSGVAGHPIEDLYGLQEVFYDAGNAPTGFGQASVEDWTSVEELRGTLQLMLAALDRPVIECAGIETALMRLARQMGSALSPCQKCGAFFDGDDLVTARYEHAACPAQADAPPPSADAVAGQVASARADTSRL